MDEIGWSFDENWIEWEKLQIEILVYSVDTLGVMSSGYKGSSGN